jgi:3-oxoadipate enol-lactonase
MFVQVRGIELWAEIDGPVGAPTLLVISGTGADLRADVDRNGDRPPHPAVTAGMRVVRYDQRGLGQSTKPDEAYSMEGYGDDAAALIEQLAELGHITPGPVSVVGISFGGMVAQHLAIRHPHLIDRLVLCCTSSGGAGGSSFDLLALDAVPEPRRSQIGASISDTRNQPLADPPRFAPGVKAAAARGAIAARYRNDDPLGAIGYRRQLEARAHHNTWDSLAAITAPTLVCGGVYDAQALPRNHRALAAHIPGATLQMFDGGHGFLFQDPDAWPPSSDF